MRMTFTVPGKPKGYVTRTFRGRHSPRGKAYHEWLEVVKAYAIQAGWQWPKATFECPIRVDVQAYYANFVGPDPDNARKAVVDALFPSKLGGDQFTYGFVGPWRVDKDDPRVEVIVSAEEAKS